MAPSNSDTSAVAPARKKLRIFLMPFFATSHMISLTDFACLIQAAKPDTVEVTMFAPPATAEAIRPTLAHCSGAGVGIVTFPYPDVGLPPGAEILGKVPYSEEWRIYEAVEQCRPAVEAALREHQPDALISDIAFWWSTDVAAELGIPRLTFYPVDVFALLVISNLTDIQPEILKLRSESVITVPDMPGPKVQIPKSELPDMLVQSEPLPFKSAQFRCFGMVVNTFFELEPEYCKNFQKLGASRGYWVGPVGLANALQLDGAAGTTIATERGGKGDVECLKWLDTKPSRSVVFVCLGSFAPLSVAQLRELALGLEASGQPFLWVVRDQDTARAAEWMPEGWEERTKERGTLVKGWAPQVAILAHAAVGAFLTHCGWNSTLEAVTAGVPMLTMPLVFEQFINERLVVEHLKIGERVWDGGKRSARAAERSTTPAEVIGKTLSSFMAPGGGGEKARVRAKELATKARAAVAGGGSSYCDLRNMIDDLMEARTKGMHC